ncbi:MAG TPA: chorismate mutase, partial [Armatimonadetes bacterium]|nr:chorismate mutase [Armatimonadota bacterium]
MEGGARLMADNPDDWWQRIERCRREIDAIDEQILKLLNKRAELARTIGILKRNHDQSAYSPAREHQIITRLLKQHRGPLSPEAVKAIYREILSGCRTLEEPLRVAFLGPAFSYTDIACRQHFGQSVNAYPVTTIPDVFLEVERGNADYGVVPIENTAEGGVNDTLDMFTRSELKICAETFLEIHHCLLARCSIEEIKVVYSRDSALAQCKNWLREHLSHAELRPVSSTTEGALRATQEQNAAAVAHKLAAEHYGLNVVAEHIEDMPNNKTRFLVIGKEIPSPSGQDKT